MAITVYLTERGRDNQNTYPISMGYQVPEFFPGSWATTAALVNTVSQNCAVGTNPNAMSIGGNYSTVFSNNMYFDGVAWAVIGKCLTPRAWAAACGSVSGTVTFGGSSATSAVAINSTESWNGSTWATTTALVTAKFSGMSAGSSTNCLSIGGQTSSVGSNYLFETEIWNGSSWATTSNLISNDRYMGCCGTTSSALAVGGQSGTGGSGDGTLVQIWGGSSWATTTARSTNANGSGAVGDGSSALAYGGISGASQIAVSEVWDGSTWATTSSMSSAITVMGYCGSTNTALSIGGNTGVTSCQCWLSGVV